MVDPVALGDFYRRLGTFSVMAEDAGITGRNVDFQKGLRTWLNEYQKTKQDLSSQAEAAFSSIKSGTNSVYHAAKVKDKHVAKLRRNRGFEDVVTGSTTLGQVLSRTLQHLGSLQRGFLRLAQESLYGATSSSHGTGFSFEQSLLDGESKGGATSGTTLMPKTTLHANGHACKCAGPCGQHQGAPFNWCVVEPESTCDQALKGNTALDVTLRDHFLAMPADKKDKRFTWDYCVPPLDPLRKPGVVKTTHGCECAYSPEILEKYNAVARPDLFDGANDVEGTRGHNGRSSKGPLLQLSKVPLRDRVTLQLMAPPRYGLRGNRDQYSGTSHGGDTSLDFSRENLCVPLARDGGASWAACPVNRHTCNIRNGFTWDYCVDTGVNGKPAEQQAGDAKAALAARDSALRPRDSGAVATAASELQQLKDRIPTAAS
ncbi:unnamed protein product [Amoebophrya sp. A120]|nr:unnamed protein product [Amoebophrya sp. A120]|eukprot:GSA120T00017781001.1